MQPANGALSHGKGVIVLHEFRSDSVLGEGLGAIAFREEPTVIAKAGGSDDEDAWEWGSLELEM